MHHRFVERKQASDCFIFILYPLKNPLYKICLFSKTATHCVDVFTELSAVTPRFFFSVQLSTSTPPHHILQTGPHYIKALQSKYIWMKEDQPPPSPSSKFQENWTAETNALVQAIPLPSFAAPASHIGFSQYRSFSFKDLLFEM